jgi:hypothetical protein
MPVIITITNELSNYQFFDRILHNIFVDEYELFYSGQNKGQLDYQLIDCINNNDDFYIYYRYKNNKPFTYLGVTNDINIIQNRKVQIGENSQIDDRLKIHMVLRDSVNTIVPSNNFNGSGKYKKDVLVHRGLLNNNGDVIIPHNRNTNLGFYYY